MKKANDLKESQVYVRKLGGQPAFILPYMHNLSTFMDQIEPELLEEAIDASLVDLARRGVRHNDLQIENAVLAATLQKNEKLKFVGWILVMQLREVIQRR